MRLPDPTRASPEARKRWNVRLFWLSIVAMPLTEVASFLWPSVGLVVLRVISWGAITYTAWDSLQTADVRDQQDG